MRFNPTYQKKGLKILDDMKDTRELEFRMSAATKIAGTKKLSFSLPAGPDFTCPGATDACKDCYAQKGRHIFSNVQKSLMRNWLLLQQYQKTGNVVGAATAIMKAMPNAIPIFRIHESGDFHSQFAVDLWTEIVKQRPNTHFWFYTRSFHLNFKSLLALPNVTGWASTDQFNKSEATKFAQANNIKQAYGPWDHDTPTPTGSFICPVTSGRLALDGACERCKLCVVKGRVHKDVVFLQH